MQRYIKNAKVFFDAKELNLDTSFFSISFFLLSLWTSQIYGYILANYSYLSNMSYLTYVERISDYFVRLQVYVWQE